MRPHVFQDLMGNRDHILLQWAATLREGVRALGPQTPAGTRLAESPEFFDFLRAELKTLLDRWAEQRRGDQRSA